MPIFLDPTGRTTYGIGVCDRCHFKFFLDELYSDPNSPGLKVCIDDLDQYDPYRLPARQSERIDLPFVRPDVPLTGHAPPVTPVRVTEDQRDRLTQDDEIRSPSGDFT